MTNEELRKALSKAIFQKIRMRIERDEARDALSKCNIQVPPPVVIYGQAAPVWDEPKQESRLVSTMILVSGYLVLGCIAFGLWHQFGTCT